MFISFLFGILIGGLAVALGFIYWLLSEIWTSPEVAEPFVDQFPPIQIPEELRAFLKTGEDGQGISKWESCRSLSLFFMFIFQEHMDNRTLRRWCHKRLQMELNDITTRFSAGRLINNIRVRQLSLGTKFPLINSIRVERVEMSDDRNSFETIVFLLDIDYTGGFEASIDVSTVFNRSMRLSVKITKLAGLVRLILSRNPYNHWTFSFVSAPKFEPEITSVYQGHQLKRIMPLIRESFRRALQRKHVWPNYKIRYRPIFPNPLFQASPPPQAFAHIKMEGGLEVCILQCTRLKTSLLHGYSAGEEYEVYVTATIDQRPFLQNASASSHTMSVLLTFSRHDVSLPIGITFDRTIVQGVCPVRILTVDEGSLADKATFKSGDVFVAINNVPIRSERQVVRFLQQTMGDLMVLVERTLDDVEDIDIRDSELLIGDPNGDPDNAFVLLGEPLRQPINKNGTTISTSIHSAQVNPLASSSPDSPEKDSSSVPPGASSRRSSKELSVTSTESPRRHSMSNIPSSSRGEDSLASSIISLGDSTRFERPSTALVQRTESARVPQVLVSQPSMDLRRTRSESQLDAKSLDTVVSAVQTTSALATTPTGNGGQAEETETDSAMTMTGGSETSSSRDEEEVILCVKSAPLDATPIFGRRQMLIEEDHGGDKDKTLTKDDSISISQVVANATPNHNNKLPGSTASLSSMGGSSTGRTTDGTTAEDAEDEDGSGGSHSRKPSYTRRQRLQAAFQAGKKRVQDLMPVTKRKQQDSPPPPSDAVDCVEFGSEVRVGDVLDIDRESNSRSPAPSYGRRTPVEAHVVDKKESGKKAGKKKNSPLGCQKSSPNLLTESLTNSLANNYRSRSTKSTIFQEGKPIQFGQSLLFELENGSGTGDKQGREQTPNPSTSTAPNSLNSGPGATTPSGAPSSHKNNYKYLNVTVHAKLKLRKSENSSLVQPSKESKEEGGTTTNAGGGSSGDAMTHQFGSGSSNGNGSPSGDAGSGTTATQPADPLTQKGGDGGAPLATQSKQPEPSRPILMGYTSLFIPQLIDDCQLTLSNVHKEVFQLKPPTGIQSINEPNGTSTGTEFSRHAGFDPRLCYGDITLMFKYYSGGLPEGANEELIDDDWDKVSTHGASLSAGDSAEAVKLIAGGSKDTASGAQRPFSPPPLVEPPQPHVWSPFSGSAVCAMCRGKIWLKSGARCGRCQVVCHNKCMQKANLGGILCLPIINEQNNAAQ